MPHNSKEVLDYWDRGDVESMYDKHLLNLEIGLIKSRLVPGSKVLDAGCGEGEGTIVYSSIAADVVGADFSDQRLKLAGERLTGVKNVRLQKVDFLGDYSLDGNYDFIVSQRFLINLMEWGLQQKVLKDFHGLLKTGGRLLMLEGSVKGVEELNQVRSVFGLEPIPQKWHNLFFDDDKLLQFMEKSGFKLVEQDGLGEYFLLTRGVRPYFDENLNWDSDFNMRSASVGEKKVLGSSTRCSRLRLWVFERT